MEHTVDQLLTAAAALRAIGAETDAEDCEARAATLRAEWI